MLRGVGARGRGHVILDLPCPLLLQFLRPHSSSRKNNDDHLNHHEHVSPPERQGTCPVILTYRDTLVFPTMTSTNPSPCRRHFFLV